MVNHMTVLGILSCKSPPRMYGLPKIYKRILICNLQSAQSAIITSLLKEHREKQVCITRIPHNLQRNYQTSSWALDYIMVSFDIVSLFPKVPIKNTLEYVKELFPKDNYELSMLCLTHRTERTRNCKTAVTTKLY